jgi:hypothetical protein
MNQGMIHQVACNNCGRAHTVSLSGALPVVELVPAVLRSLAVDGWLSWNDGQLCPRCAEYALRTPRGRAETHRLIGAITNRITRSRIEVSR